MKDLLEKTCFENVPVTSQPSPSDRDDNKTCQDQQAGSSHYSGPHLDLEATAQAAEHAARNPYGTAAMAIELAAAEAGAGEGATGSNGLVGGRRADGSSGSQVSAQEEPYPEGGLQAWLVVLGSWLALFSSLGLMNSLATFQTYVSTHQLAGMGEGTIGWIFSVYTFLCFFTGVYVGPLFDKYGPRWLVLAGAICTVVSLILLSFCTQFWHFMLAFGLLGGMGSALLFTPSIAAVGHFFSERRGFATGIASTGGGMGGVCIPLMLQSLFERVGWVWAIRILALQSLVLSAAANLLIRSRLPPAQNASTHPDPRIFRNIPFLLTTIGIFFLEFTLFIPLTYISSYALERGFSVSFASQAVTVLNASSVVGRVLPGWYADKIGPFNANMIAVVVAIAACLVVWLPTSMLHQTRTSPSDGGNNNSAAAAPLVIFAVLFGFTSGSNISIAPVSIGRLCATEQYGRYYASCYTVVSIATLIGIPIAGNILVANNGRFWGLIVLTAFLYIGSLVALMAAKMSIVGWKPWAKL